jgi:hypothetical protein
MTDTIISIDGEATLGTKCPTHKLEIKEREMTSKETIQQTKEDIALLQEKLKKLEEMEKHKSPVEEAYKRVYGWYPDTGICNGMSYVWWDVFCKGYNASQKDYKVGAYQPTPQEPKERKTLYQFLGEYKYGVGEDFPNFDDDEFSILDWHQIFIDYLYECCDIINEDDKQITVKINQSQLGGLND